MTNLLELDDALYEHITNISEQGGASWDKLEKELVIGVFSETVDQLSNLEHGEKG